MDWKQAEKVCFNEWSNPDDEELGIQIVKVRRGGSSFVLSVRPETRSKRMKFLFSATIGSIRARKTIRSSNYLFLQDLHRTGCSLFCGAAGRDNQAVLRRVLLGFARWNKSVGYCQGLNVLAALVLQVMDRAESSAVKVMIYLIEGVLPEGYFADNLRGLSVDMAVFRDLLRSRMPKLSKHLEILQSDAKDKATGNRETRRNPDATVRSTFRSAPLTGIRSVAGSSYEPPLTNVFTMQWFLTLFCHCLPQDAVLRVWDLIFLEGDQVLLRTALAIWESLSEYVAIRSRSRERFDVRSLIAPPSRQIFFQPYHDRDVGRRVLQHHGRSHARDVGIYGYE